MKDSDFLKNTKKLRGGIALSFRESYFKNYST